MKRNLNFFYICLLYESFCLIGIYGNDSDFKIPQLKHDNTNEQQNNASTSVKLYDRIIMLYCNPEPFQHFYLENGQNILHKNHWTKTRCGETGTLQDICLFSNGSTVFRRCLLDSDYHPIWDRIPEDEEIVCMNKPRESIITNELNKLNNLILSDEAQFINSTLKQDVTQQVLEVLQTPSKILLPTDVYFIGNIIKEVVKGSPDVSKSRNVLNICHDLMKGNSDVLHRSMETNSTNVILNNLEKSLNDLSPIVVPNTKCSSTPVNKFEFPNSQSMSNPQTMDMSYLGVYAELLPNISVFYVNPNCNQIAGIAIYDQDAESTTRLLHHWKFSNEYGFKYGFIYFNDSINSLRMEPKMQVASFLTESIWKKVEKKLNQTSQQASLVLHYFANDSLFVENTARNRMSFGKVLSISVPNYHGRFDDPLPYLMRKTEVHNNNTECGYWNYNTWMTEGVEKEKDNQGPMVLCYTTHLTPFTYLMKVKHKKYEIIFNKVLITPILEEALDIITTIGCMLSLLGLLGIWISAAFLSSWRTLDSTKILLNMCFALTFQMVLVLFVNQNDFIEKLMLKNSDKPCIIIGASLQYVTLVLFVWMLIIALLQFQRYVTVLGVYLPDHYVCKAAFVAWTLPLIPTLLLVFMDPKSYLPSKQAKETKHQVCYPSEMGLILGVVVPVGAVVVLNFSMIIYITCSVFKEKKITVHVREKNKLLRKLRLSVFLFFLLGVSWIFGLLNLIDDGIIFSYLFCLTATLQGFVLFLYFVILDKKARQAWKNLFFPRSYKKHLAQNGQSMSTTSTLARNHTVNNTDYKYY